MTVIAEFVTDEKLCQMVTMTTKQLLLILILLPIFVKQSLSYFEIANQIYDEIVAQVIRNMEMVGNNLKLAT